MTRPIGDEPDPPAETPSKPHAGSSAVRAAGVTADPTEGPSSTTGQSVSSALPHDAAADPTLPGHGGSAQDETDPASSAAGEGPASAWTRPPSAPLLVAGIAVVAAAFLGLASWGTPVAVALGGVLLIAVVALLGRWATWR